MELIARKRYSNFVASQSGEPSAANQLRHHNLTDLAGCYNKMVDKIGLLNKSIRKLFDITNRGIMEKLLRFSYRNFAFHQIRNQTTKILDDIAQLHAASDNEEVSTSLSATCNCTKEVMYIWDNFLYDISQTVGIISPAKPQEASYSIIAERAEEEDDAILWKEYIQLTYEKCSPQMGKWKNEMHRLRRNIMKVIQKCRVKSIEGRKQCRLENTNLFQMGELKFTGKDNNKEAEEAKSNKTMMEDYEKEKKRRKFYCQTNCREENPSSSEEQAMVAGRKPASTKKIVLTFVLFSEDAELKIKTASADKTFEIRSWLSHISFFSYWDTVGDAISEMLLVESILYEKKMSRISIVFDTLFHLIMLISQLYFAPFFNLQWTCADWNKCYNDLPKKQCKVKVKDRTVIQTTDAERRVSSPLELQQRIDDLTKNKSKARLFVRYKIVASNFDNNVSKICYNVIPKEIK
eukprot:gene1146-509_t